jgi:hypothetical protein
MMSQALFSLCLSTLPLPANATTEVGKLEYLSNLFQDWKAVASLNWNNVPMDKFVLCIMLWIQDPSEDIEGSSLWSFVSKTSEA